MADRLGSRSTRAISCPGGEVRYELERKRVRNINLRVRRDGSVYASAAPGVPAASVDDFVRKKEAFIRAAQREFARRESAPPSRLFQSGERFCFLGQTLLLRVEDAPRPGAVVEGGELLLRVRGADDAKARARALRRFVDEQAQAVFSEALRRVHPRFAPLGVPLPTLRARFMKSRWGTCLVRRGVIILNKKLVQVPPACIEYVAAHECCHFLCPNHSPRFYALLTQVMPDWKARKALLAQSPTDDL